MDKFKRDCFFFSRKPDCHGGEVATCQYDRTEGYCPCEGCSFYIDDIGARQVVQNYVDARLKEGHK